MSADPNQQSSGTEKKDPMKVQVTVDRSAELDALQRELIKARDEAKAEKDRAEKLSAEKLAVEQEKGNLLSEKEQLEGTLATIAEKEFKAKKEAIMSRVNKAFAPEDKRLKEIEAKLNDPEHGPQNLKEVEYTMGILEDALSKKQTEIDALKKTDDKKKDDTTPPTPPAGVAPVTPPPVTPPPAPSNEGGYDSYEAMISDLVIRARDPKDPAKQAEAQAILNEFWKKWAIQVKKDFETNTKLSQVTYEDKKKEHHGVA